MLDAIRPAAAPTEFRLRRVVLRLLDACILCGLHGVKPSRARPDDLDEREAERFTEKEAILYNSVANMASGAFAASDNLVETYWGLFRRKDSDVLQQHLDDLHETMDMTFESAQEEIEVDGIEGNPLVPNNGTATPFHKAVLEVLFMSSSFLCGHALYERTHQFNSDALFQGAFKELMDVLEKYDIPDLLKEACRISNPFGGEGIVVIKTVLVMDIFENSFQHPYLKEEEEEEEEDSC